MIPDKIYLHEEDFARIYTQPSSTIDDDIEYIRKEALMEWLDGKLTIEGAMEGYVGGYDSALKDVIDKLNKM